MLIQTVAQPEKLGRKHQVLCGCSHVLLLELGRSHQVPVSRTATAIGTRREWHYSVMKPAGEEEVIPSPPLPPILLEVV